MFRALFFALAGFAAMTLASMAGFAFVITGPPSADERAAFERVLAKAAETSPDEAATLAHRAAQRVEKEIRKHLPEER